MSKTKEGQPTHRVEIKVIAKIIPLDRPATFRKKIYDLPAAFVAEGDVINVTTRFDFEHGELVARP